MRVLRIVSFVTFVISLVIAGGKPAMAGPNQACNSTCTAGGSCCDIGIWTCESYCRECYLNSAPPLEDGCQVVDPIDPGITYDGYLCSCPLSPEDGR